VGLSELGPAENAPFRAPLSEGAFSARKLGVTSASAFAERMAAEQKPRFPRGRRHGERGPLLSPRRRLPSFPLRPGSCVGHYGLIQGGEFLVRGAGLGVHFKAVLRGGEGWGCCQPPRRVLPQLLLWMVRGVLGAGAACRARVQGGTDFCPVTEGRGTTGSYKGPCVQDGSCCLLRARRKRLFSLQMHRETYCLSASTGPEGSITAPRSCCYKEVGASPSSLCNEHRGSDASLPTGRRGGRG